MKPIWPIFWMVSTGEFPALIELGRDGCDGVAGKIAGRVPDHAVFVAQCEEVGRSFVLRAGLYRGAPRAFLGGQRDSTVAVRRRLCVPGRTKVIDVPPEIDIIWPNSPGGEISDVRQMRRAAGGERPLLSLVVDLV